jgi:hypothetical protein
MIDTICAHNILYDLKIAHRNSSKKGCIQEQQQEMLAQASILFNKGLPGRPPITQFPALTTEQDTGFRARRTKHGKIRFFPAGIRFSGRKTRKVTCRSGRT